MRPLPSSPSASRVLSGLPTNNPEYGCFRHLLTRKIRHISTKVVALSSGRHIFFHAVGDGTGKQIESVGAAHGSSGTTILSMLASKDGKFLVTTAAGDSRARLWTFPSSG